MKKSKYIILIILILLISVGCSNEKTSNIPNNSTDKIQITTNEDANEVNEINCTREATAQEGINASFNYQIYYQNGYIKILHSTEKVTSDNSNSLDEYEIAYKNIQKRYNGLKYYDNNIIRDSNSVTNDTTINYEKIDTKKLLEIEGSEDNVIKNGKVKLETWMNFAKKLGVTCDNK